MQNVVLGLGFNGYQQLNCLEEGTPTQNISSDVTVNRAVTVVTYPGNSKPEISITWDSIHISSPGGCITTGRWGTVLRNSDLIKYNITNIKEVGQYLILKTDSTILVVTSNAEREKLSVHEQELSGVCSFSILDSGSVYTLLATEEIHTCSVSPAQTDTTQLSSDTVSLSIGPQIPTNGVPISQVSCGADHLLLLSTSGSLFSFGLNSRGQLGHGDILTRTQPTLIAALDGVAVKDIACGHWHCLALSVFGDVYSWGWNKLGQLGHSELPTVALPTLVHVDRRVEDDVNISCVSCGSKHSVVLSEHGVVYGWGWNGYGQLGGTEQMVNTPRTIQLPGTLRAVSVCGGYWNTLVVCTC